MPHISKKFISYNDMINKFAPELKPESKAKNKRDEKLLVKVSALLLVLEKAVEEAIAKGKESESVMDITAILDCLKELEKLIGNHPAFQNLKEKLNTIMLNFAETFEDKLQKQDKEQLEEVMQNITALSTAPTPFSITPKPTPKDDKEEENKKVQVVEVEGEKPIVHRWTEF